jgi:hypothetical protein
MSDSNNISVDVVANASGVRAGMRDGASAVSSGVQSMRDALLRMGGAANDSAKKFSSFSDTLQRFKSEQTQQARAAHFFAAELIGIIPGADGAKGALQGLIGIGLEGLGWGVVLEGAIFILGQLKTAFESDEAAARHLRDAFDENFSGIVRSMQQVQDSLHGPKSKTETAWEKELDELEKKAAKLRKEIGDLRNPSGPLDQIARSFGPSDEELNKLKELAGIRRAINEAKPVRDVTAADERATQHADVDRQIRSMESSLADDVVRLGVEQENKLSELDKRRDLSVRDSAALREATEREFGQKILRLREDHRLQVSALERNAAVADGSDVERIQTETENKIAELRLKLSRSRDAEEQQLIRRQIQAESELGDRKVEIAKSADQRVVANALDAYQKQKSARIEALVKEDAEVAAIQRQLDDQRYGEEFAAAAEAIRQRADNEKRILRESQRDGLISFQQMQTRIGQINTNTIDHMKKAWVDAHRVWVEGFTNPIASSFQAAFHSLIDSTQSFAEAMKNILVGVVDQIIAELVRMAVEAVAKSIAGAVIDHALKVAENNANIAVAVSGAAASQASIPFAGPFLAAGAASSMLSLLEGMTGPLLASAAGGFDVPMGVNPITQIHSREMVLPERYADVIRGMAAAPDGGVADSGDVHVHLHFDGFADGASVRRGVESSEFRRALREAKRNGLI